MPAEQESVCLTVTEVETLVGPLTLSALLRSYWRISRTARRTGQASGFVARLDLLGQAVTFTRRQP
ncbi:MAG: DUF7662 domain-containing protein [Dehalococcoidia bacterium]